MGSNILAQPQISMVAQSRIIHPNYNPQTYANDLALLRLPLNLTSTPQVQWIRLPTISQTTNQFVNANATLSGYGRVTDQSKIDLFFPNFKIAILIKYLKNFQVQYRQTFDLLELV